MSFYQQWWQVFIAFAKHWWRRFQRDRCFLAASTLCYTSLLAIVPLFAVFFAFISVFPIFEQWNLTVQDFIFNNFVPAAGEIIQNYLNTFVEKATKLTATGIVFLVLTALIMMSNIERTLNNIWDVERSRTLISRFVVYWSTLTLGSFLIVAALAVSSYVLSLPIIADTSKLIGASGLLLQLTPFLITALAFTFIYLIVPNKRIPIIPALVGGLVAALLFEFAKQGFVFYVTKFNAYEKIYGALATIPIFLLWIYLSWVVVLLGASFAASIATFHRNSVQHPLTKANEMCVFYSVIRAFWQAQRKGEGLSLKLLMKHFSFGEEDLRKILATLSAKKIIQKSDDNSWVLSRDVHQFSLLDLYRSDNFVLPSNGQLSAASRDNKFNALVVHINQLIDQSMDISLAECFAYDAEQASGEK